MRYEEEVKATVDNLGLLNEALVHVGALWGIVNECVAIGLGLLEEALAYTFVDDDEGDLGLGKLVLAAVEVSVLIADDPVQLVKLKVYNLLSHTVTNTVTVDENVVWHLSAIEFSVALE